MPFSSFAMAFAIASRLADAPAPSAQACVQVWNEARVSYPGYNHIVHLDEVCEKTFECVVTTDTNPTGAKVIVHPREQVEILMFRGSPARVFTSHTDCTVVE